MAKPITLPVWATDATYTNDPAGIGGVIGTSPITVPALGAQQEGHLVRAPAPARYENWRANLVYQWCAYVNDASSAGAADLHLLETDALGGMDYARGTIGANSVHGGGVDINLTVQGWGGAAVADSFALFAEGLSASGFAATSILGRAAVFITAATTAPESYAPIRLTPNTTHDPAAALLARGDMFATRGTITRLHFAAAAGSIAHEVHSSADGWFAQTVIDEAGGNKNNTTFSAVCTAITMAPEVAPKRAGATMLAEVSLEVGASVAVVAASEPSIELRLTIDDGVDPALVLTRGGYTFIDGALVVWEYQPQLALSFATAATGRTYTITAEIRKTSGVGPSIDWRAVRLSVRPFQA